MQSNRLLLCKPELILLHVKLDTDLTGDPLHGNNRRQTRQYPCVSDDNGIFKQFSSEIETVNRADMRTQQL